MNSAALASLAVFTYVAATGSLCWSLRDPGWLGGRGTLLMIAAMAIGLHGWAIVQAVAGEDGLNLSFLNAMSTVAWLIAAVLWLITLLKPIEKLGIVVFPLAGLILLVQIAVPSDIHVVHNRTWPMTAHIVTSMLAFSFLNMAAFQSILLAAQDFGLRQKRSRGALVASLPPLQTMETLLFQLIAAGFVLLTVSLSSGFMFLENMFAQHLVHKTVLSILAWLVFAVLLLGRARYGWRGQLAIRSTLAGFVSLLLAYFGSKMVLEIILDRA